GAVHETFAAHAAQSPEAPAISAAAETWTYAELDAAANRIAHRLIDGGVRPGEVVAVYAHRSAALVRALLGAWKAGAAFAVLDPAYPPARLAAQAGAARPAALLRIDAAGEVPAEAAAALAESARLTVVLTADGKDGVDGFPSTAPAVSVGPDDLAYVAFTSGTTGAPKAIAGTHRPLAHFFGWYANELGLTEGDRCSLLSGLAHDPLLRDVCAPLFVGGRIAIPDPDQVGTPGWLAGWMRGEGITVAHLTPAMGQVLATGSGDALPALRLACFGGDLLRAADVARVRALAPDALAVNFYGATETPQAIAAFRVPADLAEVGEVVPVGGGIEGVDLLVLAPGGGVAGVGELGEIAVRTPYLSRGYLNDAELTAARFVANPLTGDPADRVYRTGDLGRYRPDGAVEPAGRVDGQVKVRGFRVELGEIEAALARHPSVREAVVAARGEDPDRVLVAYVVPSDIKDKKDTDALRAHLRSILPEYMVPSAFVVIDTVPLTANGKVDRRALPEPEPAAAPAPDAPLTPTEEAVAAIWREVLGVDVVRAGDDFFALGGHSLRATQVLSRIQERLGVTLPVKAIFAAPTLAGLAAAVEALRPADAVTEAREPAAPAYPPGVYPLSFAQQRLWVLMQLGSTAAYNVTDALRFTGPLDDRVLEYALTEIVRRHEPLRTRIELRDGEPVQVVQPARPVRLRAQEVSADAGEARDAAYARIAEEEARAEFSAEGPFFRARLLRADDEDHVLLWTVHHVATDGWSQGIFRSELLALYQAFARDEGSPLADLPTTYGRFALRQREEIGGERLERMAAWWKERMTGAPELLELPTDHPRPAEPSGEGAFHTFRFAAGRRAAVEAFARERGATAFMVLLAAFQAVLGRWAGQDDVVVGTPIANRTRPELEPLIGFFANTLALRGDLSGDPGFSALVERVRETTLGAYEHQDLPFERLVAELHPERSMSHAPVFQVMFILQNAPTGGGPVEMEGVAVDGLVRGRKTSAYDLSLSLYDRDDAWYGTAEYALDLFEAATIERMMEHLDALLDAALDAPDVPLSALPPLSDEDRAAARDLSRGPDGAAGGTVLDWIAARTSEAPDAVAVVAGDEALTYGELDARASKLAAFLRARGIGPEARVAIAMERGAELAVSVLGVLKAGAAYLPVDPAYPAERIEWMLADSGAALVLTQTSVAARIPSTETPAVAVDAEWERIAAESGDDDPAISIHPLSAAYVIYTSGSTGRPKGVVVTHAGLANLAAGHVALAGLTAADRVTQFASFSFDISVEEIFPTWAAGAALVFRPAELPDGAAFSRHCAESGITVADLPTAFWHEWVAAMDEGAPFPASVRICVIGGERARSDATAAWVRLAGGARLLNSYGPTEATVTSTVHEAGGHADPRAPVPIGRPTPGMTACVLDARMRPVPVGVPGELCQGGAGVARGYLGRAALTAAAFVPDPLSGVPGARLYRTGDRVRWRESAELGGGGGG
ncbi:MAG: amino acid adenylation domain-containing protein, partial [Longimicrobiaceae bacterium]